MSTVTPPVNVPVPPGGEADQWVGDHREVYAVIGHVPVSNDLLNCPAVTVVAEQRADGSVGAIDVHVYCDPMYTGLDVSQARELARLIGVRAVLADRWADRAPSPVSRLVALRADVESAYRELRLSPGNAGDYLRAALDSVTDAIEAARR